MDHEPKTAGIRPAQTGPLAVLQFADCEARLPEGMSLEAREAKLTEICEAAMKVAGHVPGSELGSSPEVLLIEALYEFLGTVVSVCPPGHERSTAISRAREAKFWASAAIAMEGK